YHTKDLGVKNTDGSFTFLNRSDLLFKSAGEMIDPLEIEKILKELPYVSEAIIVAIDHPEWTKASTLLYKLNDKSKSTSDLKAYLKDRLHPFLIPRFFYEMPDDMITSGIKPKRFEVSRYASERYFQDIFSYQYQSHKKNKLVVVFHGFMEDHKDMMPLFNNNLCDYLLIDLPGHGKTSVSNFKNRNDVFFQLKKLIQYYSIDHSLIFYGYSMGGRIALELSDTLKPDLLILESASFGLKTDQEKIQRVNSDRALLSDPQLKLENFFLSWYQNPIFGKYNESPIFKEEIKRKLITPNESKSEWQKSLEFFSPGLTPDLLADNLLKLKKQKIIGIVGQQDRKYVEHYQDIKSELSSLLVYEIENAGHNPHKTHKLKIKEILDRLLIK
ncbi:MAG: alpha/beta fold hydrolase, partial [Bdellovibrionales bacterium]|nr:alpha/beta fold hydrolase [Bdellovibrionales bacterium]